MNLFPSRQIAGLNRLPTLGNHQFTLRLLSPEEADLMVEFRLSNREYLRLWEPYRPAEFFTLDYWRAQLRHSLQEFHDGQSVAFVILGPQAIFEKTKALGVINFTSVIRGTFQACHLGYALAEPEQGKGIMTQALSLGIDYMFNQAGLHRIMANYLPQNKKSAAVLSRLGFTIEGKAKKFMKINGVWEDHILTSLVNPYDH